MQTSMPFDPLLEDVRVAMRYGSGTMLAEIMQTIGPMTESEVAAFVVDCLECAQTLHNRGMAYCGFVESNIIIATDNELVLVGMGSADRCGVAPSRIYPGRSPHDAVITNAFDIYMLGRLAVTMLMGKPEDVKSVAAANADWSDEHEAIPDATTLGISKAMHALLARATASDPSQRFGSALEMAETLEAIPTTQVSADGVRAVA